MLTKQLNNYKHNICNITSDRSALTFVNPTQRVSYKTYKKKPHLSLSWDVCDTYNSFNIISTDGSEQCLYSVYCEVYERYCLMCDICVCVCVYLEWMYVSHTAVGGASVDGYITVPHVLCFNTVIAFGRFYIYI